MAAIVSFEPAAPDRMVAEVAALDLKGLDRLLAMAERGGHGWARSASARSEALHHWADRIAEEATPLSLLIAREVGKTIRESRAEVKRAEAIVRYYSQAAYDGIAEVYPGANSRTEVRVQRIPLGVVAAICPWNFPLAIPIWKLAPALAYGNAVVFKPASAAVGVGRRLVELARPSIPEDVLCFAPLRGGDADALVEDPRVNGVSFTGSTEVGGSVVQLAARRGAAVQAEMGGQNASIVLPDADLDLAAATITEAAMGYAGQKCTATSRILVMRDVYEAFVERLTASVASVKVGDPVDEATDMGPVISEEARDKVERAVDDARRRGASSLVDAVAVPGEGWFVPPRVLAIENRSDPFVQRETFGPAVAVMAIDSTDEAIDVANNTAYGLSAAVFGSDSSVLEDVAHRLDAGMVRINASTTGADYWVPFGGEKASSYGPREQGREVRSFYTKSRTITTVQA